MEKLRLTAQRMCYLFRNFVKIRHFSIDIRVIFAILFIHKCIIFVLLNIEYVLSIFPWLRLTQSKVGINGKAENCVALIFQLRKDCIP